MAGTDFYNPSIIKYIISASDIRGYLNAKSASVSANSENPTSDTPLASINSTETQISTFFKKDRNWILTCAELLIVSIVDTTHKTHLILALYQHKTKQLHIQCKMSIFIYSLCVFISISPLLSHNFWCLKKQLMLFTGYWGDRLKIFEFSLLLVRSYWNFHTICKIEKETFFVLENFSIYCLVIYI